MSEKIVTYREAGSELDLHVGSLNVLSGELQRTREGLPWTVDSADHVLEVLLRAEQGIAAVRTSVALARFDAARNGSTSRKTEWLLTVNLVHYPWDEERYMKELVEATVEDVRGFAFPGEPTVTSGVLVLPFEVEANERATFEYVDEVRNLILGRFGIDYTIERKEKQT